MTIADIMSNVVAMFNVAVQMISKTTITITNEPLLLVFTIMGFVGLGIGLTKRLLSLN